METSKLLLSKAIDILKEASVPEEIYAIGGGTVLSMIYNHRISKDIDIFMDDPQFLTTISPRLNNIAEEALDYDETSRFISLTFSKGKIDFIVSPNITKFYPIKTNFLDYNIKIDDPVEIICKKIFFRGDKALPRDIFDLAVVFNSNRKKDLITEFIKMPEKINAFIIELKKYNSISENELYSIKNENMLLPQGKKIKGQELKICKHLMSTILNIQQNSSKNFLEPQHIR